MATGENSCGLSAESDEIAILREKAWIGDAVLALYARRWIVANAPKNADRTELFKRLTSNQFLSGLGEPTKVEARIGRVYEKEGEAAAFAFIEETILPLFLRQNAPKGRR
jgi:hypothetical protein